MHPNHHTNISAKPSLKILDPPTKSSHNFKQTTDLIKLILQLIDCSKDRSKSGNLDVGNRNAVCNSLLLDFCCKLGGIV